VEGTPESMLGCERGTAAFHPSVRRASPDDAHFLAWALLESSRSHLQKGWFDVALERGETETLEFLRRLTSSTSRSRWHYSRFWIAEIAGQAVASLCAFRAADAYRVSPLAIRETAEALRYSSAEHAMIWKRGAYLFACTPRSEDDCWVIESIATLQDFRKRGCTGALLARAIEEGRELGMKEAEVTLLIGNEAAERVYERAGFQRTGEWRHPAIEAACGAPGLRRLSMML
jgi:GNAT superfamily N-acetyltransferase